MPRKSPRGTGRASRRRQFALTSARETVDGARKISAGGTGNDAFTDGELVSYNATTDQLESAGVTSGSFGPVGASYLVVGASASLTAERVLTAGDGIDFTDGGANSPFTITVDLSELLHNDLSSLQGGTAGEFYHLTSAEYTGTGTGIFVRASSPTLTAPTIGVGEWSNANHSHSGATSGGTIAHSALTGLTTGDPHTQYLLVDGTRGLSANWNAGAFKITANQFASSIASGTAPFEVNSSTVVTNLNADLLDGNHAAAFAAASHTHDHGAGLTGLSDDDHTQYALLAGRSGGQTLKGGTAATDTLTFVATAGVGAGSEYFSWAGGNNGATEWMRVLRANSQTVVRINRLTGGSSPLNVTNTTDAVNCLNLAGSGANCNVAFHMATASGSGSTFIMRKSRGTDVASPTQTLSGDYFCVFECRGTDNTNAEASSLATFRAYATQNITTTAHGSEWEFVVVANGSTTQTSVVYFRQDGAVELTTGSYLKLTERTTTPTDPSSGAAANVYIRGDKLVIQFNDGGTVRYKYLDLTGTGVTWVHTTTAPT
jgi:hypothetical protein